MILGMLISSSLSKCKRSKHIHLCRCAELATILDRQKAELKYCYACFDWYVEEEWYEHCQMHLKSIPSKRCGQITYCGTLVRPAYCPFCLNEEHLAAPQRWRHWIREEQLRLHLQSHLRTVSWPLQCPHPLCCNFLENETCFHYHMADVHGLNMRFNLHQCQKLKTPQNMRVNQAPSILRTKRSITIDDESREPALKRSKCEDSDVTSQLWSNGKSPTDASAPDPRAPEIPVIDLVQDNDFNGFPRLSARELGLSSDGDDFLFIDDVLQNPQHAGFDVCGPRVNLPDSDDKKSESEFVDENALFPLFLRSRSPSPDFGGIEDIEGNQDNLHDRDGVCSHVAASNRDDLQSPEISYPANPIHHEVSEEAPPTKPRVILRLRPPKQPPAKSKALLRLSQPKAPGRKPSRPKSSSNRRRPVT